MKNSNRLPKSIIVAIIGLLAFSTVRVLLAQPHEPPPRPTVVPLIGQRYANDADGDRIDDRLLARAHQLAAAERTATTAQERSQARARLSELARVELIFNEPVSQSQIDTFTALGGEITHMYKAVSFGWNARLPLNKLAAVPAAMGATLVLIEEPGYATTQLDEATQACRIRQVWAPGFAGSLAGFSGNTNTTIAILDTGVDDTHADLAGRQVYWHDYTASAYGLPIDVAGHGSHVAGIALGTGAGAGLSGPLLFTQDGNLAGSGTTGFFISPVHVPSNSATFTISAQWLGGGSTALSRASKDNGNTNNSAWSFGATTNGFSPLILTSPPTFFTTTRAFTPALRGSGTNNNVSNFVASCAVSNYPAIDGFNRLRGVAPGCNWAGAKVLSDTGSADWNEVAAGIDDLVANRSVYNIKVMNLSVGGSLSGSLRQKINTAVNNGIIMAVAAGNRGTNYTGIGTNGVTEPGRAAMALTVAAANDINQLTDYTRLGFFSPDQTPGQEEDYKPDLMAPGGSDYYSYVLSVDSNYGDGPTFPDQRTNDYRNFKGTSMATPFIAGSAALVIEAMEAAGVNWDFNSSQHSRFVKMVLCATASESNTNRENNLNNPTLQRASSITNGTEVMPAGKDLNEGYGMLNVEAAVEAVAQTYTPGAFATATFGSAPAQRRVWARTVNLFAGRNLSVTMTNPATGDFDVYLYSTEPNAFGTPVLLASSTRAGNGTGEQLDYWPASDAAALLVVKRVSGSGTFGLIGNVAPAVDFAADPTIGPAPLVVNFTNFSSDATNYSWNFGDGNTSTTKDASNVYANVGTYTVSLTATGPGGTNQITKPGLIVVTSPPPIVSFSASPLEGHWPLHVTFSNSTLGATNYAWDFGDGSTSELKEPDHTYLGAGTFSVTLTALGAGGTGSVTAVNYILVTNPPAPIVDFTAAPTEGLAPLNVSFTSLAIGGITYQWSFGDGESSTSKDSQHTYTNPGSYSVTFTVVGPGGTNSLIKSGLILVTNPPLPEVDFVAEPAVGMVPLTVFFTNLTSGATNYAWDFGDGQISAENDPVNIYTNSGIYTVTLAATGPGGTKSAVHTSYIVVTNPPAPVVDFAAAPTEGLAPLTVSFTSLATGGSTYEWNFGDGESSASKDSQHTYANAGTYSVTFTVVGPGGTNSLTKPALIVVTNPAPPAPNFVAAPTKGFTPLTTFFTNLTGQATSYQWDFGDGNISTEEHPTHVYATAGQFAVSLTAFNASGSNTLMLTNFVLVATPPSLKLLNEPAGKVTLSFETIPEKTYVIEFKNNLGDSDWQLWLSVPGDGAEKTFTEPIDSVPQRFFRLRVEDTVGAS